MDGAVRGACDAVADLRDHIAEVAGSDGPMAEAIRSASAALIEQLQEAVAAQADADSPGHSWLGFKPRHARLKTDWPRRGKK